MHEREFLSMKELTLKISESSAELWILNRVVAAGRVSLISKNRMLYPCQVNANLVCSSSF